MDRTRRKRAAPGRRAMAHGRSGGARGAGVAQGAHDTGGPDSADSAENAENAERKRWACGRC